MAYDGFLSFGGNEVINSERARGYSRTSNCPMFWLKDQPCTTLAYAIGDVGDYSYLHIEDSPWYDSTVAEISKRFFGVYGLEISGVEDSTRSASVTEGIADGGVIGRPRRAMREVRVKALLLGQGQDAVEYGMSWLNSILDPDGCGQISEDCGTATMGTLSTCPPERGTITYLADWELEARNLYLNPSFEGTTGIPAGASRSTEWAHEGTYSLYIPPSSGGGGEGYGHGNYGHTPYGN